MSIDDQWFSRRPSKSGVPCKLFRGCIVCKHRCVLRMSWSPRNVVCLCDGHNHELCKNCWTVFRGDLWAILELYEGQIPRKIRNFKGACTMQYIVKYSHCVTLWCVCDCLPVLCICSKMEKKLELSSDESWQASLLQALFALCSDGYSILPAHT